MAITYTFRSSIHSVTDATSYVTGTAFTPAANTLMVAFVISRGNPTGEPVPTVTGNGATYSSKANVLLATSAGRMDMFVADSGAAPSNGAITATGWGSNRTGCHITVIEVGGEDLSGGDLAAIVQAPTGSGTATSGSITLAAAGAADNRPIACFQHKANEATTFRTNWTELDDGSFATPASGAEAQGRTDAFETTASASWTTSSDWVGIAAEVKAEAAGTSISFEVGAIPF